MILCPSCNTGHISSKTGCEKCGFKPVHLDGFLAWAPELAKCNEGFPPGSFKRLARLEAGNFWFRTRNRLVLWALRKYFPSFDSLLEIGCGTGFVLTGISKTFPAARLVGSEIYTAGLEFASLRLPNVELIQMDARRLPYEDEFDVVTAFDVIEHILEDEHVLKNLYRATKPGGGCLITVPQHKWLWSPVDEEACHQRRYGAAELHRKIEAAGFTILRTTSFVTLLLPLMLVSRLGARRSGTSVGGEELQLNARLDRLLELIMRFELWLISLGVSLPMGGSRLVVARRNSA